MVAFYEAAVEIKPVRVLYHSVVRATLAYGEIRSSFYSRSSWRHPVAGAG
jgi:hypothetical protein